MRLSPRIWQWLVAAAVIVPCVAFWTAAVIAGWEYWQERASEAGNTPAYLPAALPDYKPPPSPLLPLRHPAPDSQPEGYEWVHGHQHGSKWVEGYWRRRPGFVSPTPAPTATAPPGSIPPAASPTPL